MSSSNVPPTFQGKSLSQQQAVHNSTQPGPSTSFELRRPALATPIPPQSTARKGQGSRKQHKTQRRPGHSESSRAVNLQEREYELAEIAAVRNPFSRRGQTSITHLLSYSITPSPSLLSSSLYQRTYRQGNTWGPGSGHHAIDKARYVHANYRFVVSPKGSYSAQASDADCHLEWADVLQVLASSESQATACPICLSDPVAPRMAMCGHIFCFPCLLRLMSSNLNSDSNSGLKGSRCRKCPICEDLIYLHDLRPVHFYSGQECPLPAVGSDVILRLMARNANSTLALPREGGVEALDSGQDVPWHFAANVLDYARIMKGTDDYMVDRYDQEIEDLKHLEEEDETLYGEDGEWTQKALKAVIAAKDRLPGVTMEDATLLDKASASSHPKPRTYPDFFFFTAQPHLYLSPLDIRILKTKYTSFSQFPSTLLPRVEHVSIGHVVDDSLRKRAKYLSHLPRGCLISFLECDWTDIVPAEILDTFNDEIERRRRRNREDAMLADKMQQQAERTEAMALRIALGSSARAIYPLADDAPVSNPQSALFGSNPFSDFPTGSTPPGPRPGFAHLASLSTSPSAPRTVWGTPAVSAPSGAPDATTSVASPAVHQADDGWLREEDVLGVTTLAIADPGVSSSTGGGSGSGTGKKKKKQKITLMSTGGRRGM